MSAAVPGSFRDGTMSKRDRLLNLAQLRVRSRWPGYGHPEDYGYDFRDLVSPYSRTARNLDADVMIVLQDWSSHDKLSGGINADVARYGHDPCLRTNIKLKDLLHRHLGLHLEDTYGTNLFPFIKQGGISGRIPAPDLARAAEVFALPQIEIVNPRVVLALGRGTSKALVRAGAKVLGLPHPAARISNAAMDEAWCAVVRVLDAIRTRRRENVPPLTRDHSTLSPSGCGAERK